MNWDIDTPVRIGAYDFAAIVETRLSIHSVGRTVVGHGEKQPLLFLLLGKDMAKGLDVKGRVYAADEIEALYPSAIERMAAMVLARD